MPDDQTPSNDDVYDDLSVPLDAVVRDATLLSLVLLFAPLIVYWFVYGFNDFMSETFGLSFLLWMLPVLLISIVIHEGLHALGWIMLGGVRPSQVSFGFDRRNLAPYTHADADVRASAYRIAVALPGVLQGVIPTIIGLGIANGPLTLYGAFMLSAAVGDMYVLWIIRHLNGAALVRDHPSQVGCMVRRDT